jgi:putative DNA primase/helicase
MPIKHPDIKTVASAALQRIDHILNYLLPQGRSDGGEYKSLNPLRDDSRPGSFSINLHSGAWADFATGDKGGDLVALWCYLQRCKDQGEAAQQVAEFLQLDLTNTASNAAHATQEKSKGKRTAKGIEWRSVVPVPDNAPPPPDLHFRHGRASLHWDYRDEQGRLLMRINRFDLGKDANKKMQKEFAPQTWCAEIKNGEPTGRHEWRWQGLDTPRPLYGLDRLAKRPDALVVLAEGEKAAVAAQYLFPEAVAMCWPGGSNAVSKTDFAPLAGRAVLFWPDNDASGMKAKTLLGAALQLVNVTTAELVRIESFGEFAANGSASIRANDGEWPEGADADDAVMRGWSPAQIVLLDARGMLRTRFTEALRGVSGKSQAKEIMASIDDKPAPTEGASMPMFAVQDDGIYWYDAKNQKCYIKISAKVEVVARVRVTPSDSEAYGWSKLLRFCNHDGKLIEWSVPDKLFAGDGFAVIEGLMERGLPITPHDYSRRKLREYIFGVEVSARGQLVNKTGWYGDTFVLPERVFGATTEPIIYQTDAKKICKIAQSGTLEQWRENVSAFAIGNDLVMFAISAAFAAPLLNIVDKPTIGFHFVGETSWGKSTLVDIASSVYGKPGLGGYANKWKVTVNGLESLAAAHSSCLLVLDELKQCDPKDVDNIVYLIGNEGGKVRAQDNGSYNGVKHSWRLLWMSNGEMTLSQHLGSAKLKAQGGQEVRLINLSANLNETAELRAKNGVYQNLHSFSHGAELSGHIMNKALSFHGTALYEFLERLLQPDFINTKGRQGIKRIMEKFRQDNLSSSAPGEIYRVADAFGLVAAAGEMATRFGITGWAVGDATKTAALCFKLWLEDNGRGISKGQRDMLEAVRTHFITCGEYKYTRMNEGEPIADEHAPRTAERFGFRKTQTHGDNSSGRYSETIYIVLPDIFKNEICRGFNPLHVAQLLAKCGALKLGTEKARPYLTREKLPGYGDARQRVYTINPAMLNDADDQIEAVTEDAVLVD